MVLFFLLHTSKCLVRLVNLLLFRGEKKIPSKETNWCSKNASQDHENASVVLKENECQFHLEKVPLAHPCLYLPHALCIY